MLDGHQPSIQAAQVGLIWKLENRIMYTRGGGAWNTWQEEDAWTSTDTASSSRPSAPATETPAGEGTKDRKLKCSQIIGQGDDSEFTVLPEEKKRLWLQQYVQLTGAVPEEEEEPTLEQLSALRKRQKA